jgi:four helix bundle protein
MERKPAKRFEDLTVWQKAHALVLAVCPYSAKFPKTETYGLMSQMRRAAVSVPANIAEGFKRRGKPDKLRFLNIAQGSLEELRYFLILAQDLQYGDSGELKAQAQEVARILDAFAGSIERSQRSERQ